MMEGRKGREGEVRGREVEGEREGAGGIRMEEVG
jgi:hypothetical protein